MFGEITLKEQVNETDIEQITICCEVDSITQSEYATAGVKDIKPSYKFTVWAHEYNDQTELEYNGQRLIVYRTYRKPTEEKVELYAEKRSGRR